MINIEIAFATPDKQIIISINVSESTTVLEAIAQSNIAQQFPEHLSQIDHNTLIGIFGKKINPVTYQLRNKDRIEIYRPLNKTPNQKRLERAK